MRRKTFLIIPALLVFGLIFCGGLIFAFIESVVVYSREGGVRVRSFSLDNYRALLTDGEFYASLLLTFAVAFISTAIAVCGGIALALFMRRTASSQRLARLAFQLPITIPHLIAAICIMLLLSQSGLLARIVGVADPANFPVLTNDRRAIGIIITYLWKELPFVALVALGTLQSIDRNYEQVAHTLGANGRETMGRVVLPLLSRAIMPVSIIVFAFIFGSYEVPFVLGASYPALLPILAYRRFIHPDLAYRPQAMALNIIIAVVMLLLTLIYVAVIRRISRS